ncbi:unnamed protein product [Camellia sinensis]
MLDRFYFVELVSWLLFLVVGDYLSMICNQMQSYQTCRLFGRLWLLFCGILVVLLLHSVLLVGSMVTTAAWSQQQLGAYISCSCWCEGVTCSWEHTSAAAAGSILWVWLDASILG